MPAAGEVLIQGKPAANVRLVFHPVPARPEWGMFRALTGADGTFKCTTNVPEDGLPPGRYTVTITWPEMIQEDPEYESDKLRGRYADPRRPAFVVDVAAPATRFPPFKLTP